MLFDTLRSLRMTDDVTNSASHPSASDLKRIVERAAEEAGFDLCGIAPAAELQELEYFSKWIADGRAGEMKYLEARDDEGELKRSALKRVAPSARSVIVCATNYNTANPYSTQVPDSKKECISAGAQLPAAGAPLLADVARSGNGSDKGWISRYAWGREDYHDSVLRRLKRVEARLREQLRGLGSDDFTTRSYVDTGPIVERVYAKYAGVGWIGKNTCIINQKKGSWLFLGVILSSLELPPDFFAANLPAPDRCGTCTRCIDACPTDAITAPYQLDSNRCIAYLTIEKRGSIPEELRADIGRHVFGCDICQDVCPWNRKAPATTAPEFQPRPGLVNPALDWLAEMTAEEFRETFRGSPIRRTKRSGLRRNVAIAMGNSGNADFIPVLDRLANNEDEDESVAESARWAKRQIESKSR